MRITIKGLINEGLPLQIIFTPRKEKEKEEEKKGYTLQTAREAAAVKVFCQNTTRPKGVWRL